MVSSFGGALISYPNLLFAEIQNINEEISWYECELERVRKDLEIEQKDLATIQDRRNSNLTSYNEQVADAEDKIKFFRSEKQMNYHKMVELFDKAAYEHSVENFTTANSLSKDGRMHRKAMRSDRKFQIFWIRQLQELKASFVDTHKAEFEEQSERVAELSAEIVEIEAAIKSLNEKITEKKARTTQKVANF